MAPSTQIYASLPNNRTIRLVNVLEITPADETKLTIEIKIAELDSDALSYSALSYTWGSPISTPECEALYSAKHNVIIAVKTEFNLVPFSINRNLYEALLRVWSFEEHRHALWIDQICIDQDDVREKSTQVAMMDEIYSQADLVIAWLGVDDPDQPTLQHVAWLHRRIVRKREKYVKKYGKQPEDWVFEPENEDVLRLGEMTAAMTCDYHSKELNLTLPSAVLHSLFRFYARRRFLNRQWVVQELVLAKNLVIQFDNERFTLECLTSVAYNFAQMHFAQMIRQPSAAGDLFDSVSRLKELRRNSRSTWRGIRPLEWLLFIFYNLPPGSMATDGRDYVYGILGMANQLFPHWETGHIPIDYDASTGKVFTDLATRIINGSPTKMLLSFIGEPRWGKFSVDLPSWVPDFSTCAQLQIVGGGEVFGGGRMARYNASQTSQNDKLALCSCIGNKLQVFARYCMPVKTAHLDRFPDGSSTISLHQIVLALLQACADSKPAFSQEGKSVLEMMLRNEAMFEQSQDRGADSLRRIGHGFCGFVLAAIEGDYGATEDAATASISHLKNILQVLAGFPEIPTLEDIDFHLELARLAKQNPGEIVEAEEQLLQSERGQKLKGWFDRYGNFQKILNEGPRFSFATKRSLFGRAHSKTKEGDELWLICGALIPFVLRSLCNGEYHLVSEAFIHGAMYGELIDNGIAGEPVQITLV